MNMKKNLKLCFFKREGIKKKDIQSKRAFSTMSSLRMDLTGNLLIFSINKNYKLTK